MTLNQLDQILQGNGVKSAFTKDSPIGATITGTITDVAVRQVTDYMTGKPRTWDDGNPQMQIVITLATNERDASVQDDDGQRGGYITTWGPWTEALGVALKAAGGEKASDVLAPGAIFAATFTGTRPSSQGSPTKLYEYVIKPASVNALDQAASPAAPAVPAPVANVTSLPEAAPAGTPAPAAQDHVRLARQLIRLGLDDETIATQVQLPASVIAAIRTAA